MENMNYQQQPQQPPYPGQQYQRNPEPGTPGNGFGIASMVLGLCSIIFLCLPIVSVVTGVVGIVLGAIGLKATGPGKGMAVAGFVLGIVSIALALMFWLGLYSCTGLSCNLAHPFSVGPVNGF